MTKIDTYKKLEEFGRVRLSNSFFMRDFLHSEIATWHQLRNVPDYPDRAIDVGRRLCEELLEPLQATFGHIHIRSGYRSPSVNAFGNLNKLNCASNESNYAAHIWDYPDADGRRGASACVVLPWLVDHVAAGGTWTSMAWWIHDHLPYSSLQFFPKLCAFNINWHEEPKRRIDGYAAPKGCLTKPGMSNHPGLHGEQYVGFPLLQAHDPLLVQAYSTPVAPNVDRLDDAQPKTFSDCVTGGTANQSAPTRSGVQYRAIHTKSKWRKVNSHRSLSAAIEGKDGAAALFRGTVRIDYEKHGRPLFVIAWESGQEMGWLIWRDSHAPSGIARREIPESLIDQFEAQGYADEGALSALSSSTDSKV